MKTIAKRLMAMVLIVLMFSISPLCDAAPRSLAAGDGGKYISEVRVGMGETEEEAKKELEAEGFTILTDESGALADLNKDAGSKSALKRGANEKIVYLGYKTTDDVNDAVTDLAVMNMKGGYSIEDYNILMDKHMNSQIKPFVDRFIATLEEYRANYKKPKSSPNYIRADYMRRLLNKLTDDDTGGQPMGDLLLNKTKYEMGDAAYNNLSDAEKKNHCDILTLLMQANGQATLSLKKLVSRASDTSDDTWVDRFSETTLDDLMAEIEEEDPSLTSRTDIYAALDRKYRDTAEIILEKWEDFRSQIDEFEYKVDEVSDNSEYINDAVDTMIDDMQNSDPNEMTAEDVEEQSDIQTEVAKQTIDTQIVAICGYMNLIEYDGETLFDFFDRDFDEVSTDEGIRSLYPIVESLSAGQTAGLDFLSLTELFSMAISDESSYEAVEKTISDTKEASVYEGVNREIYEKGGVALTSDALRAKALAADSGEKEGYKMGTLPIVFWGLTAGFAVGTVVSGILSKTLTKTVEVTKESLVQVKEFVNVQVDNPVIINKLAELTKLKESYQSMINTGDPYKWFSDGLDKVNGDIALLEKGGTTMEVQEEVTKFATKTESKIQVVNNTVAKYLA
ncbi:MAG: hypothetical protein J6P16_04840, partial [Eubacterium sp.]|nr:hypothetical protein [Eubacterium sp.]